MKSLVLGDALNQQSLQFHIAKVFLVRPDADSCGLSDIGGSLLPAGATPGVFAIDVRGLRFFYGNPHIGLKVGLVFRFDAMEFQVQQRG